MKSMILILNLCLLHFVADAQNCMYALKFTTKYHKKFTKSPKKCFKDTIELQSYLSELSLSAYKKGHLLANYERVVKDSTLWMVDWRPGPRFKKVQIALQPSAQTLLPPKWLGKTVIDRPFTPQELYRLLDETEKRMAENGYPFSQLTWEVDSVQQKTAFATLKIHQGPLFKWSKIIVRGDSSASVRYLTSLLQIRKGEPFNISKSNAISSKIAQVPFLQEIKSHELLFTPEGVELYLYVEAKKVSSLNGVLGLQQKPDLTGYQVSGELALQLWNVLKNGEKFQLDWRNLPGQTQQLKTGVQLPFLFRSGFGIGGQFQLYKRDTTFLEVKSGLSFSYAFSGTNNVYFFYERYLSSSLGQSLSNASVANIATNKYGLGLEGLRVDYLPNPTTGWEWNVRAAVGNRRSLASDTAEATTTLQLSGEGTVKRYFNPIGRHVIQLAARNWFIYNDDYFRNELYRFGGLNHQRGFNEDEFFASTVATLSVEYRYLLDRNSRLFLFYEQSFYDDKVAGYFSDTPYGFGAGLAFNTNIGTFTFIYALGSQRNNPIELRNGRIHFGYIAYF